MNKAEQDYLDAILAKDANDITDEEAAVLRARISYLSSDQKAKFADALKEPKAVKKD